MRARWLMMAPLAVLAACGGEEPGPPDPTPEQPAARSPAGYDGEIDPEALAEAEAKADGDPCRDYPGGTQDGADLLVLVNKAPDRALAQRYDPPDLFPVDAARMMPGRKALLRAAVADAFSGLVDAAMTERGFDLRGRSGYRSYR